MKGYAFEIIQLARKTKKSCMRSQCTKREKGNTTSVSDP